jgi:hypothetical protein
VADYFNIFANQKKTQKLFCMSVYIRQSEEKKANDIPHVRVKKKAKDIPHGQSNKQHGLFRMSVYIRHQYLP